MSIYHNYAPITTKDLTITIYFTEMYNYTGFKSLLEEKIIEIQRKYKNKIVFQTGASPPGNTTYGLLFSPLIWPPSQTFKTSYTLIEEFLKVNQNNPSSGVGSASIYGERAPIVTISFNKINVGDPNDASVKIPITISKDITSTPIKTVFKDQAGNQVYLFDNSKQRTSGGKKKSLRKKRRAPRKSRKNRTKRNK
jgi:hypothetical protein